MVDIKLRDFIQKHPAEQAGILKALRIEMIRITEHGMVIKKIKKAAIYISR